ncbi:hypothetical protein [Tepidibacillus marianensis]|uniref:hypothetical protein n=1 Tax=Tepidibacillus marianensis TaxID=3131995 RepID=UPI0030CDEC89
MKGKWIFGILVLILLCLLFCFRGVIVQWISDYRQQEEWNQGKETPSNQKNHTVVPKLDQLVSQPNFVTELQKNPIF